MDAVMRRRENGLKAAATRKRSSKIWDALTSDWRVAACATLRVEEEMTPAVTVGVLLSLNDEMYINSPLDSCLQRLAIRDCKENCDQSNRRQDVQRGKSRLGHS